MRFTVKYGVFGIVSGTTEDWGVATLGEVVNSDRCRAALRHPDNVSVFISGVEISDMDHKIIDGCEITLQPRQHEKG